MTDEELIIIGRTIVTVHHNDDPDYWYVMVGRHATDSMYHSCESAEREQQSRIHAFMPAMRAVYRAGLEEAKAKIISVEDKHKWCWAIDEYMKWLDAKLKERP